jgi:hypothetical protein
VASSGVEWRRVASSGVEWRRVASSGVEWPRVACEERILQQQQQSKRLDQYLPILPISLHEDANQGIVVYFFPNAATNEI